MIRKTQQDLVSALKSKEGFKFTEFELETISRCEISDSDWNYKDIPHLKEIHHLVEGYPAYAGDDFISALLVQKVFGIRFPAVLFNYQSGKDRQTYFITMMGYLLIVETTYESLGKNRTKTKTRYAVGCRGWLGTLLFPLCRLAIKRNFENLMGGDLPMRDRRGELRDWGYSFKGDGKPYSFFETSLIMETNVIPPSGEEVKEYSVRLDQMKDGEKTPLGRSDQFGLLAHFAEGKMSFFPRLCPHEGADMSHTCDGKQSRCEWHGRKFTPIFSVATSEMKKGFNREVGGRYRFSMNDANEMRVSVRAMTGAPELSPSVH